MDPTDWLAIAPAVAAAHGQAAADWPGVFVPPSEFAECVAGALAGRQTRGDPLAGLRLSDLYLACACARGEPTALAVFDRAFGPVIERAVRASGGVRDGEVAEIVQIVRVRLLVARDADRRPRIASYQGRSSLTVWLKVVAAREAARLLQSARREEPTEDDELAARIDTGDDPEIAHVKRVYRDEFRDAFRAAVEGLSDGERLLLRQNVLDGLGIDRLAGVYGVHRATVARRLEAARMAVVARTRRIMAARLRVASTELESILRLIGSQLDVSLPHALRQVGSGTPPGGGKAT